MNELIETERLYVEELQSIIEVCWSGYFYVLKNKHFTPDAGIDLVCRLLVWAKAKHLNWSWTYVYEANSELCTITVGFTACLFMTRASLFYKINVPQKLDFFYA